MKHKMLIGVVRKIVPRGLRLRVGPWLEAKLVRPNLLAVAFYYFRFGIVIRARPLPDGNYLVAFQGTEMIMPKDYIFYGPPVVWDRVYEQYSSLEEGNIVIDVGANIGMFTVRAAELVGVKGLVVAIEPEPRNLTLLQRNIESHNLNNVKVVRKAVSDKATKMPLYLSNFSPAPSLSFRCENYIEVEVDSLDSIVSELELDHVDFIKINAEGVELEILKGAEKILASSGVKLCIAAHHPLPEGQPELPAIVSYLASKKFQTQTYVRSSGPYIYATNCCVD